MPFFISKKKLEWIKGEATLEGWRVGYTDGKEVGRSMERIAQNIKVKATLVKPAENPKPSLNDRGLHDLLRVVPALAEYTKTDAFGPFLDRAKLREDSADLEAYKAAERGAKIALTLAGDTADYANTLKEEGK